MSKKLIAVAAATALALTGLVASPAFAAFGVTKDGGTGTGATTTQATTVNVPTENVVRFETTEADSTAIEYEVTATTATGTVLASTTGAVKVLNQADYDDLVADGDNDSTIGSTSASAAASGSTANFYVFTTSTTAGTVTFSNGGNSTTLYVKGIKGLAYTVTATGPATGSKGVTYKFTATVKDMYGNGVSGLTVTTNGFVVDNLGAFTAAPTLAAGTNGTGGVYNFEGTVGATGSGIMSIEVGGTAAVAGDVTGLADSSLEAIITIGASDPSTQITALTAQVAALTAQLANSRAIDESVTKKKFNALAKRWNRAFPGQKVALKK